jgi:hypothetical protein
MTGFLQMKGNFEKNDEIFENFYSIKLYLTHPFRRCACLFLGVPTLIFKVFAHYQGWDFPG